MNKKVIGFFCKWFSTGRDVMQILKEGDTGAHIYNICTALLSLGYRPFMSDSFTDSLSETILKFQKDKKHRNQDGQFGPGTRDRLVRATFNQHGADFFLKTLKPTFPYFYQAFISYSWDDTEKVNKLDQWLREHGISVIRDFRDFQPGHKIPDEIRKYLYTSDKAVIIYSNSSKSRDWTQFECTVAQEIETLRTIPSLVYLLLDNTKPPRYDPNRIYINAMDKPLRTIGTKLHHAITGKTGEPERLVVNEDEPL